VHVPTPLLGAGISWLAGMLAALQFSGCDLRAHLVISVLHYSVIIQSDRNCYIWQHSVTASVGRCLAVIAAKMYLGR
jgi:hypothetical protein